MSTHVAVQLSDSVAPEYLQHVFEHNAVPGVDSRVAPVFFMTPDFSTSSPASKAEAVETQAQAAAALSAITQAEASGDAVVPVTLVASGASEARDDSAPKSSAIDGGSAQRSMRERLKSGLKGNFVWMAFAQGSTLLANVALANLLGRAIFGQYAIIQSTLLTLASVAQGAVSSMVAKYVAEFRSNDKPRAGRIIGLCSLIAFFTGTAACLTLLIGAPWIAAVMLKAPHLEFGLRIAGGVVFLMVLNAYQQGALVGLEAYPTLARVGMVDGTLYLLSVVLMAHFFGLAGAVGGLLLSACVRCTLFFFALRRETGKHGVAVTRNGAWQERALAWRFALPMTLSSLSSVPTLWLANTMLVRQPDGYHEMGIYSAANNLKLVSLFIPTIISSVFAPLLNNSKSDAVRYRKVFRANVALTAAAMTIGVGVAILFGNGLLRIFGKEFVEGRGVLAILMLSAIPEALISSLYQLIQSQERMWQSLLSITLPRDLSLLLLSFYLVPRFGALGLAWVFLISRTFTLLMMIVTTWRMAPGLYRGNAGVLPASK